MGCRIRRERDAFWLGQVNGYVCDRRYMWESDVRLDLEGRQTQDIKRLGNCAKEFGR